MKRYERHGHTNARKRSAEHYAWTNMIQRCTNAKRRDYAQYGGRGIKVVKAVNAHDELVEHATYLVERLADAHDPMREADITIHAAALRAALSRIQS